MENSRRKLLPIGLIAYACIFLAIHGSALAQQIPEQPDTPAIVIALVDEPPYAFLDEAEVPNGILVDFWRQWAQDNNHASQFIVSKREVSLLRMARGGADMHGGTIPSTDLTGIQFTDPFLTRQSSLYTFKGSVYRTIEDLQNSPVGALSAAWSVEYLNTLYPDINVVKFNSPMALVEATAAGTIDAFVLDDTTLAWVLQRTDLENVPDFEKGDTLFTEEITAAVFVENKDLWQEVSGAVKAKGVNDRLKAITNRWTAPAPIPIPEKVPWHLIVLVLSAGFIILITAYFTLKRRIKRQRSVLEAIGEDYEHLNKKYKKEQQALDEVEEQVRFLTTHDKLTDLPNQRLLEMVYPQISAQTRRQKKMIALLYIDLENFKAVNESLGRGAGDAMLKTISEDLILVVRRSDVVARIGSDEFVILATNLDKRKQAEEVAGKVVKCLEKPFNILGQEWKIQSSVGVCIFPDDAESFEEMLSRAKQAMCIAKATESHTWRFWGDGSGPESEVEKKKSKKKSSKKSPPPKDAPAES